MATPTKTTAETKPTGAGDLASVRDELHALSDEIEVKLHLAKLEARDEWADLKKRLGAIEQRIAKSGARASASIGKELAAIGAAFQKFRDEVIGRQS